MNSLRSAHSVRHGIDGGRNLIGGLDAIVFDIDDTDSEPDLWTNRSKGLKFRSWSSSTLQNDVIDL